MRKVYPKQAGAQLLESVDNLPVKRCRSESAKEFYGHVFLHNPSECLCKRICFVSGNVEIRFEFKNIQGFWIRLFADFFKSLFDGHLQ